MSGEIEVVFKHILKASSVFEQSGRKYADVVPKDIGPPPKVTEGSLEQAMCAVLEAIEVMHDVLGASMQTHGRKLKYVHDTYRRAEHDVKRLLDRVDDPKGIQPRF
ncbi:DUF6317 family protein [Actinomadura sp. 21ATH]|uniref:DUF6317 family protein n=1 Tax=Actinomadura sp. 21ATH TaxID=1735444 RepID=UPI0035BEE99F